MALSFRILLLLLSAILQCCFPCHKTQALMGATRPEAAEKCPDARRVAPIRAQCPGTTVLYMAPYLLFNL